MAKFNYAERFRYCLDSHGAYQTYTTFCEQPSPLALISAQTGYESWHIHKHSLSLSLLHAAGMANAFTVHSSAGSNNVTVFHLYAALPRMCAKGVTNPQGM